MSEHAFTPGPWKVCDDGERVCRATDDDHRTIAHVASGEIAYKANAKLLPAAPDLLAACQEADAVIEALIEANTAGYSDTCSTPDGLCGRWLCDEVGCVVDKRKRLRAAIRKAVGE